MNIAKTGSGLNVPVVTVLDDAGEIIEADQRRLIRYVIQSGAGANSLFLSGTTGEFAYLTNGQRQRLIEIGCEEIRTVNAQLPTDSAPPVEAWAGVTAPTKAETLENLALAVHLQADMAVIAPMAIEDLLPDEIVRFFQREVAERIGADGSLTVALYDNPDIAPDSAMLRNIPTAIVEKLNELRFVVCLKASTTRDVLQSHLRISLANSAPHSFDVYVGNASLIFEYEDIQREAGVSADHLALAGVVAGPANLLPREWRAAWQAVVDRNAVLLGRYQKVLTRFDEMCFIGEGAARAYKGVAVIKQALYNQRLISSPCVRRGTPALTADEARRFDDELSVFLEKLKRSLNVTSSLAAK